FDVDLGILAIELVTGIRDLDVARQRHDVGLEVIVALLARRIGVRSLDLHIAVGFQTHQVQLAAGLALEVAGHGVGTHSAVRLYHCRVAPPDRALRPILIFEAIGSRQLLFAGVDAQSATGDRKDARVQVVYGVIAGDRAPRLLQAYVAVGLDLPDFRTACSL